MLPGLDLGQVADQVGLGYTVGGWDADKVLVPSTSSVHWRPRA
jgi:hypothetical protein